MRCRFCDSRSALHKPLGLQLFLGLQRIFKNQVRDAEEGGTAIKIGVHALDLLGE